VLRYLVDESVHGDIVRALLRGEPDLPLVTVQDTGWQAADDAVIIERSRAGPSGGRVAPNLKAGLDLR
jgi:hypothetical protein